MKFPQRTGRKLLPQLTRNDPAIHKLGKESQFREEKHSHFSPKNMSMAVPGMFILCCVFLCPCFQAKKKETDHAALAKEPTSSGQNLYSGLILCYAYVNKCYLIFIHVS